MALPSQTERSNSSSRVSASRTRGMSSKVVAGVATVVVAAAAVGGYLYFKGQPAAAPSTAGGSTGDSKTPPKKNDTLGSKPPVTPGTDNSKKSATPPPVTPPTTTPANTPTTPPSNPPTTLNQGSGSPSTGTPNPGPAPAPAPVPTPAGTTPPSAEPPKSDSGKPTPVDLSNPSATPGTKAPETTDARPPAPTSALPASGSTADVKSVMSQGDEAQSKGNLVQARQLFSKALLNASTSKSDQEALRKKLTAINQDLIFSPKVVAGDPLTETYAIQSGDAVARLPRKRELAIDWRLLKRVNNLTDDDLTRLKVGQKIKLVRGPFHAVVTKAEYRLDIFAGSPDEPENWVYIRSFNVGLGEGNGTPVGSFVVKSRQVNPPWTNPKTGEKFAADDPKNPVGEYWIGWEGVGPSASYKGFGIHGTVDPGSIGQQKSMGCVRLVNDDVAMVYEMLTERISVVQVRP